MDEVYWSTLLQHLGAQVTGALLTYMEPGDPKTGHSRMFSEQDVAHLWSRPPPFSFARKFPTTPRMDAALAAPIKTALAANTNPTLAAPVTTALVAPSKTAIAGVEASMASGKRVH